MELGWLEDFLALAQLRNFSKAAVMRHATQSAMSRRMRALEAWYGVPLVDRSTYPVALTAAGQAFLPVCETLVTQLYRSRREARAELGAAGRTIRFAMPHSLAVNFFPTWWRSQRGQADLLAKVVAADLVDCIELLLKGACQFLLYYTSPDTASGLEDLNLRRRHVGSEQLVPVSSVGPRGVPTFDFTMRTRGTQVPLLTYPSDSFMGRITARLHAQLETHWTLLLRYESSLVEALKAEAVLGEGVAWLPQSNVRQELEAGKLRVLTDARLAIPLDIWLCAPASTTVSATARSLLGEQDLGTGAGP